MGVSNLVELLLHNAEARPEWPLYTYLREEKEEILTCSELDRRSRRVASILVEKGVKPGDRVLINHLPGLDYITAFFGTLYSGAITVPVYPPRFSGKLDRLRTIVQDAAPRAALTSKPLLETLTLDPEMQKFTWIDSTDGGDPHFSPRNPDPVAFIQYTSGSTSAPKGVLVGHDNILENMSCIRQSFSGGTDTVGVIWLPPYHDMGLVGGILSPLGFGCRVILLSPYSFLQRPVRWLETISKYSGTASGAPNFAYELCNRRISEEQMRGLNLSSWKVAFCGAEPIQERVLSDFAAKFSACGFKKEALHPCYGLAEATLLATGASPNEPALFVKFNRNLLERSKIALPDPEGRAYVSSGRPPLNHSVRIVDPVTLKPCPERSVGEIWFSGPSVAKGYWNKNSDCFHARVDDPEDQKEYLRTGDLGFLLDEELFVTGRQKELIILKGVNHYPQDIEGTVQRSHDALRAANGAAFSVQDEQEERLVIIQEVDRRAKDPNFEEIVVKVREAVLEHHGVLPHCVTLVKSNSIPLTSSGKIQRGLCREWFLEGRFS